MRTIITTLLLTVIFSLSINVARSYGQSAGTPTASVTGTVSDPQGGRISGAIVMVENIATGSTRELPTDESGTYLFTQLPPGPYQISVTAEGFNATKARVELLLGTNVRLNCVLQPGAVSDIVEVSADNTITEGKTERTAESDTRLISALPIDLGQSVYAGNIVCLLGDRALPQRVTSNFGYVYNSQQGRFNNTTIDGLDNNDTNTGPPRSFYNFGAVQQFQILSNNYSAEFGRITGGCFVNGATKSGENSFHGTLASAIRNDALSAREAFSPVKGDAERYNVETTLSGPVKKDRAFFFLAFGRLSAQQNNIVTIRDEVLGTARPLGFPLRNGPVPFSLGITTVLARFDAQLSATDSLWIKYNGAFTSNGAFENFGGSLAETSGARNEIDDNTIVVNNTYINAPLNLVNETRFLFNKRSLELAPINPGPMVQLLPPQGFIQFGRGISAAQPREENIYQLIDIVSLARGRNQLKFGVDLFYSQFPDRETRLPLLTSGQAVFLALDFAKIFNRPSLPALSGIEAFSPALRTPTQRAFLNSLSMQLPTLLPSFPRGVPLADLPLPSAFIQGFGDTRVSFSTTLFTLFAQDDIKLSPNLFVKAGLRYDLNRVSFGPDNSGNISPRLAFSYRPAFKTNLNIRGGFGLFFGTPIAGPYLTAKVFNAGFQLASTIFPFAAIPFSLPGRAFPTTPQPPAFAGFIKQLGQSYQLGAKLRNTYTEQANFGLDYFLDSRTTLSIDYNFTRGLKIAGARNINPIVRPIPGDPFQSAITGRPDATRGLVYEYENNFDSYFHALTISSSRRIGQRFGYLMQYTLSKAIDNFIDISGVNIQEVVDPLNLRAERGLSLQDIRNRFVFAGNWNISYSNNPLLKGYQVAAVIILQSGLPYNLIATSDLNRNGDYLPGDRPALLGRNVGITPGFATVDLRVARTIRVREGVSVQAVVEIFNLFNRVNISEVDRGFPADAQGRVDLPRQEDGRFITRPDKLRNAFSPRQIQLGFSLNF